jgi:hypothetical protein
MIRKVKNVRLLLLTASLLLPLCGFSQNYAEDMGKITEKFKAGDLNFHVNYLFYPYDSSRKAIDTMKVNCFVSGGEYYYKINSGVNQYEYYCNNKYFYIIDHSQMAIAVKKNTAAGQQVWDMSRIDSLIHQPDIKISYKDAGNNEGEYDIKVANASWNSISIIFNKSTYRVSMMRISSDSKGKMYGEAYNKPVIKVYYTDYSGKPFDKSIFNESRYFNDSGKAMVLNDTYKKYKVLDYVHTPKS